MTNTFQQTATTTVDGFPQYLWSNAANWKNGVPVNGGQVSFNIVGGGNPSGYDDIANLYLDSLTLTNGEIGVAGTLTVATVTFGASSPSLYSDSILSGAPSALTIDAMNTGGFIGAFGAGAVTSVLATADPGEVYQADEGGEVVLSATPNAGSGYYYQNSIPAGTFAFRSPSATISGILDGVAIGDSIALPGSFVSSVTFGTSSMSVVTNLGTTTFSDVVYSGTKPTGYTVSADPTGLERVTFACFVAGTRISTARGEIAVEDIAVGDKVWAQLGGGLAPVTWVGHRKINCAAHPKPHNVWPVRVAAGAFGVARPCRDLFLSPDHAIYVDGVLIPVKHLINGRSIAQVPMDEVTYYHVELPNHEVLVAENLPTESYLDTGDRANFANGGDLIRLFPDFSTRTPDACAMLEAYGCVPLVVTGPALKAARMWVNALAAAADRSADCQIASNFDPSAAPAWAYPRSA